jgi:hypothetical protein
MALNGVITRFMTGTYGVTRTVATTYPSGGFAVGGATLTFNIDASIQPITGRDLKILTEAQRAEESRVIYTLTELKTRGPGYEPDVVTINSEPWTVFKVEFYEVISGGHYRAYVARKVVP